jgi:mannose-1-phosphate guanylyltransferase/mannose-6-phosphate isomerase
VHVEATQGADALVLVLPADGVIADRGGLAAAVEAAIPLATAGRLVLFGVRPEFATSAYGYVTPAADGSSVARYVEKPSVAAASAAIEGGARWNAGMILARTSVLVDELAHHAPATLVAARAAVASADRDLDFIRLGSEFLAAPVVAFERAILERSIRASVVALDAGWADLGSWSALWAVRIADADRNVILGDAVLSDVQDSYIHAGHRLVAAVGLRQHVVVETADAVLVAPKDRVHEVRAIVDRLRASGRSEAIAHTRVARPWGSYETVDRGPRFQVKRITVNPGASLSLQLHHRRAEHWVIVRGVARITRGDETFDLVENESTFIPVGTRHRLENAGEGPLEMIEVQSGDYLGEDDIVRFDDRYGRR